MWGPRLRIKALRRGLLLLLRLLISCVEHRLLLWLVLWLLRIVCLWSVDLMLLDN